VLRFIGSFFGGIFTFVTLAAMATALMIGGILWFYSRDLPSHESLAQYTPPTISRIYSGEGRIIDEFAQERRLYTPIEDVPAIVKQAFVAAEDQNFYTHKGYDAKGMVAAAVEAVVTRGQRVRGASTITQQVMKNFLLGGERTGERKIKEIILATRIEQTLSKDKILELYLNEIFLGQNSYGVAAAAQTYFNKALHQLELEEAAVLASLPTQPSNFHPVRNRDRLLERRGYVLRRMFEDGYITRDQLDKAIAAPLRTVQGGEYAGFRAAMPPRDYFTDEIRRQLSSTFGEAEFFGGGLTIRATVDPEMQRVAAAALRDGLEKYDRNLGIWRGTRKTIDTALLDDEGKWRDALAKVELPRDVEGWYPAVVLDLGKTTARIGIEGVEGTDQEIPAADVTWARKRLDTGRLGNKAKVPADLLAVGDVVLVKQLMKDGQFQRWSLRQVPEVQGAFMAMDVNTGRVISMQGGFSYQDTVFNRATQAMRQPGSSFKPFVYAAAMDNGFTPATIVVDAPIEIDTPQGIWKPKNASNRFYGPTPVRTGIEQSRNLMTIRIAEEIGMETVAAYAERFGVYDRMGAFLASSLGSEETTLFKMVAAYAMFANGGERVEPTLVDRVQDRWGRTVYRHDQRDCVDCRTASLDPGAPPRITAKRERVMDAITAYQLTSMLEGAIQRGTGRGISVGAPVAGKTGTTNDAKDVWFVGYTSNIVAGCYIGYDTPRSLGNASGGGMCGPVFSSFMKQAVKKYGGTKFKVPPGGYWVKIDRFTGARLPDNASGDYVVAEYFREGQEDSGYGFGSLVDGGFGMGSNLPLFARGESDGAETTTVTTASGQTRAIPKKADFGTVSSGGLY
jgi:penicillin-binding protein 1A